MNEEIQSVEENKNDLVDNEQFQEAIQQQVRKIHNEGMLIGFQTACNFILRKIYEFERKPGSKSTNDYKRLVKDVKKFVETGVSKKVNENEKIEVSEETESTTIQN